MEFSHGLNNAHYFGSSGGNIKFTSGLKTKTKEDEDQGWVTSLDPLRHSCPPNVSLGYVMDNLYSGNCITSFYCILALTLQLNSQGKPQSE